MDNPEEVCGTIGFVAPVHNRPATERRLRQLCRRAHTSFSRLGTSTAITFVWREFYDVATRQTVVRCVKEPVECDRYELGDVAAFAGHRLLARIEHHDVGNLVLRAPGSDIDLVAARTAEPWCDHCRTKRRRNDTFWMELVEGPRAGQVVQIGRNCLAQYLRVDPAHVLAMAKLFGWLETVLRDGADWCGSGGFSGPQTLHYVACVVASHEQHGFRPASFDNSTRSDAYWRVSRRPNDPGAAEAWDAAQPAAAQVERARTLIAWARESEDASDYGHNLRVAASLEFAEGKRLGILASICRAHERALGLEAERAAKAPDAGHYGSVGDKVEVEATLLALIRCESDFGSTLLHKFRTSEGHDLVWFSSGRGGADDDAIGKVVSIRGRVKSHGTYNDRAQTTLTRCKVQQVGL